MAFTRGYLIALLGAVLATPPPVRHIRFRAFTPGLDAPFGYVEASASAQVGLGKPTVVPLHFLPTALSQEYEIRGADPVKLVNADGREVGRVLFPADGDYFTVILLQEGDRYRAHVFDGSETNRPAGSISVLNLSGTRHRGEIRSESIALGPGINGPYAVGSGARVVLRTRVKDRDLQVFGENLSLPSGERGLLLLLPPFREGSLEPQWRYLTERADYRGMSHP